MRKGAYYILLVLFGLVLAVELHFCYSVIFKTEKRETSYTNNPNEGTDKDKDDNKDGEDNKLEGYLKTLNYDEYVYQERNIDINHVIVGEEIRNDKEYIRNYKIIMNGKITDMVVSYVLDEEGDIKGSLKYGEKTMNLDVFDIKGYGEISGNLLNNYIENFAFDVFEPENLEFFKGDDGKDYVIFDMHYYSDYAPEIVSNILNDNFEKLKANINGREEEKFFRYNGFVSYVRLDEYRPHIGYLAKRVVFGGDGYLNLAVVDGKVRYVYIGEAEKYDCNRFSQAIEYELSVRNNKITLKALDSEKVFWETDNC